MAVLREALRTLPERHCPDNDPPELKQPRALLILDNVDRPELLAATQVALLPAEQWLELIVTTRLDPAKFGGGHRAFALVAVSMLPEADAVRLLADFQPDHRFASAADEEAARSIARALGGYTLAVELVAAYLGDRARDGYAPSHYLPRLDREGLVAPVDTLAGETAVQAQIRHSADVAQNHIGTLIRWSLDRLSPPARTALEFASLLMPDEIPLGWLETLTRQRHAADLEDQPHQPPKWPAVWRELRGLRLLHPARELEVDDRHVEQLPQVVRIHRLVAEHVSSFVVPPLGGSGAPAPDRLKPALQISHLADLDQFLTALAYRFQEGAEQADYGVRAQHPWLRDQLDYLIAARPPTPALLRSAQVAADFEGQHGSLARGISFFERILTAQEQLPKSADNERSTSASLNTLAAFLAARGQPGAAEAALGHYQRSLQVREDLRRANPQSAQAARDVWVSCWKLARLTEQTGPGDAMKWWRRAFEILDGMKREGRFLSAQDQEFHEQLRRKLEPRGPKARPRASPGQRPGCRKSKM